MSASQRSRATRTVYRSGPLCEAHCGVAVELAGDSLWRGYLCPNAYGLKGLQEDPDRLRQPLLRGGSRFREAAWEEALDLVATRLAAICDAHGADAIAS